MSNLTLVIDNRTNVKHQILKNLQEHNGKPVSMFCAIRNIEDTFEATQALHELVSEDLVERRDFGHQNIFLYRYRSELNYYRRLEGLKSA